MPIFVIMYDETQQVCPVEAATPEDARKMIAERLGRDVSHCPIYNADNDNDIAQIESILRNAGFL